MNKFIQYFKDNPTLVYVTIVIFVLSLLSLILIILARKAIKKKRNYKLAVEEAASALQDVSTENLDDSTIIEKTPSVNNSDKNEIAVSEDKTEQNTEFKPEKQTNNTKKAANKPINEENSNQQEQAKTNEKPAKFVPERKSEPSEQFKAKYSGKWIITVENGTYIAKLTASNGEVLIKTEAYTSLAGVKSGIETVKNNILKDNFAVSVDKTGDYYFKLYSSSKRLLCVSAGYSSKSACMSAIESAKRFSQTAVIEVLKSE